MCTFSLRFIYSWLWFFIIYCFVCFFFNDTATTEIYTLSLHDALPISWCCVPPPPWTHGQSVFPASAPRDRKSTRLNSSHQIISYAVFCLKKKTQRKPPLPPTTTKRNPSPRRDPKSTP